MSRIEWMQTVNRLIAILLFVAGCGLIGIGLFLGLFGGLNDGVAVGLEVLLHSAGFGLACVAAGFCFSGHREGPRRKCLAPAGENPYPLLLCALSEDPRRSLLQRLDAFETAASMLSIVLLAVMTGAILGALYYVVTHWPEGYGVGPQGELFYLTIGFVLVIGWVLGQLSWIIRRRRRDAWTFKDGSEIPLPQITTSNEGFSINWGRRPDLGRMSPDDTHSWSATIPVSPYNTRAFRLDADALAAARAARASGADWDEVCRQTSPEWPTMNALDRALYRNALEAALNTPEADQQ